MNIRAHVIVSGIVQGVFFRSAAREKALELGLFGWVRNLPDGRVEAIFEGDEGSVGEMVEWCKKGPINARVDDVSIEYQECSGEYSGELKGFSVIR